LVKLDPLTWQELHDYSNRDKWRMVIGIMDYGVRIRDQGLGTRDLGLEIRDSWRLEIPIALKQSMK